MLTSFANALSTTFLSLPEVTQVFVVTIAVMTGLMVGPFYNNRTLAYGPTILTMAGIFGCFLGISPGLLEFNTSDIQGSVPSLVDGIRTAFWASVSGVGGALLIKIRLLIFGLACTRFRRHQVRCFNGTGGASWSVGNLRGNSSLRLCG